MGIARNLINWCDNKFDEALHEKDDHKAAAKASVSGFVEGVMDAAVVMYIPVLIACWVYKNKAEKK